MARPRVFISSTFYDLKQVRADIERFVRDLGYEAVRNESGGIPYGAQQKLEHYCYKEVELCDILVAVIGGNYGSSSQNEPYSITQQEIKTAWDAGKQVYVFIEKNVKAEYETYRMNKENDTVTYRFVDDIRVYRFLDELSLVPVNNQTYGFETSEDIIALLREQWAGLLQRFIQEQSKKQEAKALMDITSTAKVLNQLVTFVLQERKDRDQAIQDILLSNHPAMEQVRQLLNVHYHVYFSTRQELSDWLRYARAFEPVPLVEWDDNEYEEWMKTEDGPSGRRTTIVKVHSSVFQEDGRLRPVTRDEWDENSILCEKIDSPVDDYDPFAEE